MADETVLQVEDLKTYLFTRSGVVKAVDGASFDLRRGETLGIVGESGSGESMTAGSILGLVPGPAGRIVGCRILYQGEDLLPKSKAGMREIRGSGICMVMQDPLTSLNPVFIVGNQIIESLRLDSDSPRRILREKAIELLTKVHIPAPETRLDPFTHQMSGGLRQRIAIARALSTRPKLIVLDEPVSALDVSIRAQILNLLKQLQETYHLSYLLIAHNLATVRYMSHRVGVMYLGKIVEEAHPTELFTNPLHPYTKALISASLPAHPRMQREEMVLTGEVPSPLNPPSGCSFHPRCPFVMDYCAEVTPEYKEVSAGHLVSCHLYSPEHAAGGVGAGAT